MSRVKRLRNMNGLITVLETIISKSQCSLSVQDLNVLNAAIAKVQFLKSKKGLTDKQLQPTVVEIVELINQFLARPDLQ